MSTKGGSIAEFDKNWRIRPETVRNFWRRGAPQNQIELAFRCHWDFINEVVGLPKKGKVLDVGAGRGSMSSFFVEAGYEVTLLDSSEKVLNAAKKIFEENHHEAEFECADGVKMPFEENSFAVVVSMGLLEHFKNIAEPIREQLRILRPGGVFVAYVIPGRTDNVQSLFKPLNSALKKLAPLFELGGKSPKKRVFRNDYNSETYVRYLKRLGGVNNVEASGVYPLPEISYSPEFPFSFMPVFIERILVKVYMNILKWRRDAYRQNPWICDEKLGQGFMVWCKKKK